MFFNDQNTTTATVELEIRKEPLEEKKKIAPETRMRVKFEAKLMNVHNDDR